LQIRLENSHVQHSDDLTDNPKKGHMQPREDIQNKSFWK